MSAKAAGEALGEAYEGDWGGEPGKSRARGDEKVDLDGAEGDA